MKNEHKNLLIEFRFAQIQQLAATTLPKNFQIQNRQRGERGVFGYTRRITETLPKQIDVLEKEGHILIAWGAGEEEIVRKDGSRMKLTDWIKQIPGIEVEVWRYPMTHVMQHPIVTNILIREVSDQVIVPQLELIGTEVKYDNEAQGSFDQRVWKEQ